MSFVSDRQLQTEAGTNGREEEGKEGELNHLFPNLRARGSDSLYLGSCSNLKQRYSIMQLQKMELLKRCQLHDSDLLLTVHTVRTL